MGTENQRGNEVMKPSELKIKLRWAKNLRICCEERNGSSYLQGRRRDDAEVRGWTMWKVVMSYLWTKIKHKEELDDFSGGSKFLRSNLDCPKISPVNFFFADIGSYSGPVIRDALPVILCLYITIMQINKINTNNIIKSLLVFFFIL